jgi:transposase-like protein
LLNNGNSMPRDINLDKNPASARAVTELKASGTISQRCRLRQCKYLNNIVKQDHRNVNGERGSPKTAVPFRRRGELYAPLRRCGW